MPPEDSSTETVTVTAPRCEQRSTPSAFTSRKGPATVVPVPKQRAAVEQKIAALNDPDEILNVIRTEAALRRAQRLSGQGGAQRQTIRLLSVCLLFGLLAAAIGAMWYLQSSLQGSHRAHRPPPAAKQ